ncbi:pentatricopeptide repeat-containing protein At1g31790-like [Dioscorea cayenensis subsp. rotundata]|uniref:Pentatricopeptide repeat-containing protein At1g31790-like n=1 Tax=Dioscorea cayennensis subsp. rotundata TaxID=55577 RepID=A0AB40AVV9_DIOCR|nr:pentatricopeptide repeat-containing protein At1g31790-like [Dioscorea cayenensis subsp. rotundata]
MELSVRTVVDPSTAHVIIPRSKSIITTRTKNKNGLRMIKSGETMVMPILLRRPQLPSVTITTVERNEEQERSRGRPSDVLRILDALHLPVDADTYSALIKECIDSRDAVQGASIHAHIQRRTRSSTRNSSDHLILADRLLLMYAACGRLRDARQLFDEMPIKDAISRLTMVSALSDRGDHVEAIKLFVDMHQNYSCAGSRGRGCRAHLFDAAMAILRSCIRAEDLQLGQQVHGLTHEAGRVRCLLRFTRGAPPPRPVIQRQIWPLGLREDGIQCDQQQHPRTNDAPHLRFLLAIGDESCQK